MVGKSKAFAIKGSSAYKKHTKSWRENKRARNKVERWPRKVNVWEKCVVGNASAKEWRVSERLGGNWLKHS